MSHNNNQQTAAQVDQQKETARSEEEVFEPATLIQKMPLVFCLAVTTIAVLYVGEIALRNYNRYLTREVTVFAFLGRHRRNVRSANSLQGDGKQDGVGALPHFPLILPCG